MKVLKEKNNGVTGWQGAIGKLALYLGLVFLILFFFFVTGGASLAGKNLVLLFNQGFSLVIIALGGVFILATGNIDFSLGANLGFSAACACLVALNVNIYLALPTAILTGMGIGIANGLVQVIFKIPSLITGLTFMFIFTAALQTLTRNSALMIPFKMMAFDDNFIKIISLSVYIVIMVVLFNYTKIGKQLKAIGVSEEAARQSGVKLGMMKIVAFGIGGAAAGMAGYFTMVRSGAAAASTGSTMTTDVILAIVLGGMPVSGGSKSTLASGIVGAAMIAILTNGLVLAKMGGDVQQLIKGVIFVIVVAISTIRSKAPVV